MQFIIIVRGTRGYGVDYGVIDPFPYNEIVSSLDRLGENILYAPKEFLNTMGRLNTISKN